MSFAVRIRRRVPFIDDEPMTGNFHGGEVVIERVADGLDGWESAARGGRSPSTILAALESAPTSTSVTWGSPGRYVVFSCPREGEGVLVTVFEPVPAADPVAVTHELRLRVNRSLGVVVGDVVPTVKGPIIKTTSGEPRRGAIRDTCARGEVLRLSGPDEALEVSASEGGS